jgi:acetyl-CoA synthetase
VLPAVEWDAPFAKWFADGALNVSHNCLDRHVAAGHGDQVAYHWEGEPGDTRTLTYAELRDEVAAELRAAGHPDLVDQLDRRMFNLSINPDTPEDLVPAIRELMALGTPAAVFVTPPDVLMPAE